ncbi:hypothetical protein AAG570_010636 [Ranatra chinensis]|uniref:Succinate dehydrogenase [ubiquinone] iron-sulfur subunit, mitochondrial n=1 Tax=Ranatra chinensis TaxID=642074 RepID=A0ABD0YN52_9HEMI
MFIKNEIDRSLTFRRSCGVGLCGSCAMNINGVNRLACITPVPPVGDLTVFPLPHSYVIKDLVVDMTNFHRQYQTIQPWLQRKRRKSADTKEYLQSVRDRKKLDGLYECTLCGCCSFACPTYWHHGTGKKCFLGPAAILQAYRWIIDSRDEFHTERLARLKNSVYKCRKIVNCTNACPMVLIMAIYYRFNNKYIIGNGLL